MKTKKRSSFRGKVAANAQKQKSAGASYGYLNLPRGVPIYSVQPGSRVRFDIMPYVVTDPNHPDKDENLGIALKGDLWYKRPFKIHRNIGVNNDAIVCLTSVGKRCPICEYRAQQIKEGASKEITDPLKPSLRNLYVVIPKDDKKFEEVPHIWDMSQFLFQDLLTEELQENEDYEIFPDLEEGLTLRVRFDSNTIDGSKPFAKANRIDFEPRKYSYDESILEEIPDLDSVLQIFSAEQIEQMFFELEEPVEKVSKVRKIEEDEEIEEDEDFEEDEEIEEEQPVRRKKTLLSSMQKQKNVTEEEDEDFEEDEETEQPEKVSSKEKRSSQRAARNKTENKKTKCPHGYKFGVDTEEYDECFDCDFWDECIDEKERNEE